MFGDTAYCKYSCWHLTGAATGAKDVFCKLRTRTEMRSTQAHCMGPYDKRTPKTSSSWGQLNRKMLALPCCNRPPSLSSYCEACEACEERQGLWPIIGSKVVKGGKTSNRWASVSISHWIQFSYADHCVSYVGPSLWQVNKHASQRHEYIQMAMRIIARVTCKSSGTGNGDESVNPAVCLCRLSCCLAGIPYQPGLADHWLVVSIAAWMRKDFCQGTCASMISRAHGKKTHSPGQLCILAVSCLESAVHDQSFKMGLHKFAQTGFAEIVSGDVWTRLVPRFVVRACGILVDCRSSKSLLFVCAISTGIWHAFPGNQVLNLYYMYIYLENQNPKNSSGQRKNLRYFGKNKKTSVFDWRPRVLILNPYLTRT